MAEAMEPACGLEVVKLEHTETGTRWYRLDEAALERLLLRPGVAERRVVVVSVAGAYRTGKSFLLGYCLRYLHATESARGDGSWLGSPREPLAGFSWRPGSEPNTTGILLWSEPLPATLPSGEQVSVLLIDTQGTFDQHSTLRDCSTVFALSALLSSVQIYNLEKDIRDDSLQHLQTFTDFGRQISSLSGETPFQALKFLIRDWSFSYEHAFGADGGRELLNRRITVHSSQPAQLQELRQSILDCFESVDCFLMPHPGNTAATTQHFNGCLDDICEDFKVSLAQLIPSIFSSENLRVKKIAGVMIRGQDLLHYFRSYIEAFNRDDVPAPVTLREATAEGGLSVAASEARAYYSLAMERACGERLPSLPPGALRATHARVRDQAHSAAADAPTMATTRRHREWIQHLYQELDSRLLNYESLNYAKMERAVDNTRDAYEQCIASVSSMEELCLHPQDLEDLHRRAKAGAMTVFDDSRVPPETEDHDRDDILMFFETRNNQLQELNVRHNEAMVSEAREVYNSQADRTWGDQPCMRHCDLKEKHDEARGMALQVVASRRNHPTECTEDSYKATLTGYMEEQFERINEINVTNNGSAVEAAILAYREPMEAICADLCLIPEELSLEDDDARDRAREVFDARRTYRGEGDDPYRLRVEDDMRERYNRFARTNRARNEAAVDAAFDIYVRELLAACIADLTNLIETIRVARTFPQAHDRSAISARNAFRNRRRDLGRNRGGDTYLNDLNRRMEERKVEIQRTVMQNVAYAVALAGLLVVAL